MVRSETTFDAEWTEDDIASALEWQKDKASRCGGCGHPKSETFDKDKANAYDAEPLACHACAAKDRAARAFRQKKGDEAGVYWVIRDREEVDLNG